MSIDKDLLRKQYLNKTIRQLDFIIRNDHSHDKKEVEIAKEIIAPKRLAWKQQQTLIAKEIDGIIRKNQWFDCWLEESDKYSLQIHGGLDMYESPLIQILFLDVYFFSGFTSWYSDTSKTVFQVPAASEEVEYNQRFEIIQDYQLFIFNSEDQRNNIYVIANSCSYKLLK